MKLLGNILWCILTGAESAVLWCICGALCCVTVIGAPFGEQCFKFARLCFMPFGKTVRVDYVSHPIANAVWLVFGGLVLSVFFAIMGVFWCITVAGIPFGIQCFKLAKLAFTPFGAKIYG